MNEIDIRLDWREIDIAKYQSMLSKRFFGRWGWTFVVFAGAFTAGLGYAVFEHFIGPGDSAIIAAILGATVFGLLASRLQRKLRRAMFDVPARQEPSSITLDAAGIAAPGALVAGRIPWRWVTEIVDGEEALLVLFSPVEFIPLADKGLPDGITREALKAQIQNWREAA